VRQAEASRSPNFFITGDFKTFRPVSNVYPEKDWNWLTSELYNWKGLRDEELQGVLYKPENFDSQKKYPVIFYYYERGSQNLHNYLPPGLCVGPINIPWFVSHGYLVFVPDIHYRPGHTGESALSAVESAARMMAQKPSVDAARMGIQGHSFGAIQTNYIVTHSTLFAAACSASGQSDFISAYGSVDLNGRTKMNWYENGQNRIGASLAERPDLYIENSAILSVGKVTTPLLLMHTTEDNICLLSQAIELFVGLRRQGKKAWMLLYDQESHTLYKEEDIKDYHIRIGQFFDHYLKGEPAPLWMTTPGAVKTTVDGGLQPDKKNITPGPGLISLIK